jgi:hypothetical protein
MEARLNIRSESSGSDRPDSDSGRSSVTDFSLAFQPRGEDKYLMKSAMGGNYLYACPEAVINAGYDHTGTHTQFKLTLTHASHSIHYLLK